MESSTGTEHAKWLPYYIKGLICLSLAVQLLLYKIKTVPVPREVSHPFYAYINKSNCNKF